MADVAEEETASASSPEPVATPPPFGAGLRRKFSLAQCDTFKYRKVFDAFDQQKRGFIKGACLAEAAGRLGYRITDEQLKEILDNNTLDPSADIGFEQFLALLPRNTSQISGDEHKLADLREKFQRYDVEGDGIISLQQAQWALQMELDVTPQTAIRLLNNFVKLNYEQFVDFYGKVQAKKLEIYDKFGKYDLDMDGLISVEEAHRILHREMGFTEERSRAMVDRFDANKDGLVSYIEFAEFYIAVEERKEKIRKAFKKFDEGGHGYVSDEHARQILQDYLGFSEQKSLKAIETYDKNKDGRIDYEEFLEFFTMMEEERQRLLVEFKHFDSDQDGRISFQEFKDMLTSQGHTEKDAESLMAGYDLDQDGYLNFEEFKHFLNFS